MISVIIPVYNGEKYLSECLDALLCQSCSDIEIIIINDGSTDSSQQIIDSYSLKDTRIRSVIQKNQGVSSARNKGIDLARGEYLYFLDCDDILFDNNALQNLLTPMEKEQADLAIGNLIYYYDDYKRYERPINWISNHIYTGAEIPKCLHMNPVPPNKLWRSDLIHENHLRFENYRLGEDSGFYMSYLALTKKVITIEACIYYYRLHDQSCSHSYSLKMLDCIGVFNTLDKFYQERGDCASFIHELNFDKLFCYVIHMQKVPLYRKKDRSILINKLSDAISQIDLSDLEPSPKSEALLKTYSLYKKHAWWFTSNLYAAGYRLARKCKHMLNYFLK